MSNIEKAIAYQRSPEGRAAASAKFKANWANPEIREKTLASLRKAKADKSRRRKSMYKVREVTAKRESLARRIRFLPGAKRIAKWLVK